MTGTNCDLFTHKSSRSYLNHLVYTMKWISRQDKAVFHYLKVISFQHTQEENVCMLCNGPGL
jgi:hypothetical protein